MSECVRVYLTMQGGRSVYDALRSECVAGCKVVQGS